MAPPKRKSTAFYRGDAGREKAEEELARQKARQEARKEQGNQPFRFRVPVGGTTQYVILDDAPDFFRFEHNLKNPQTGFWDTFTGCVKEWDNCPVCAVAERESYYAMYLTVLDFTEFKTKDGQKHEFSRKLLVIKPAQQKKFQRAFSKAEKDGRTLRGTIVEVTRDGEKDSAIGNDIEFIDVMDEDELTTYVRSWKDKEGKKHTEKCYEPYDYEQLFQEPDTEQLRALVGAAPAPGSRAHEDRELGRRSSSRRGRDEDDEDYEPAERKSRMGGKGRSRDADEDEDGGDEEDSRPARGRSSPARGRRTAADDEQETRRPARNARGRSDEDDSEDENGEDDEDSRPARRTAGRRSSEEDSKPARGSSRRSRDEDEEPPFDPDEEDDDSGSRRKAPGVGRRVQARGRR